MKNAEAAPWKLTIYWHFLNFSENSSEGSETSEISSLTSFASNLQKFPQSPEKATQTKAKIMNQNEAKLPEPLLYDIKQVAAALNTCTKTVRRLIQRGYFTPCKAVRKILIPREQIEAFLKATYSAPAALR
jgi:excisionase family DNA binding protein